MKCFIHLSFLILFSACSHDSMKLFQALKQSGPNRPELEKVLSHYADDTLKLKAARFLIENMPGHYTWDSSQLTDYRAKMDSIYPTMSSVIRRVVYSIPWHNDFVMDSCHRVEDIRVIKGDYLIRHIDNAVAMWQESPWLKDLSFEDFCEYLLPYRLGDEPLAEADTTSWWWKVVRGSMDDYQFMPSLLDDVKSFQRMHIANSDDPYFLNMAMPLLEEGTYTMDCLDLCYYDVLGFRQSGIPSTIDLIPDWPTRNGRHYWRTIIDGACLADNFNGTMNPVTAKVYRMTYSHNPVPKPNGRDAIPALFQEPFYKDVTQAYVPTSQVEIDLPKGLERVPSHVYLAVFNDLEWKPIAWSAPQGNKATFSNMGQNIVYLPVYFDKDSMKSVGHPFLLDHNGHIKPFVPDLKQPATLTLNRKHPLNQAKILWGECLKGCYIEASDHADFSSSDTLCHIHRAQPNLGYTIIRFPEAKTYRYWRIVRPRYAFQISECQLFGPAGEKFAGKALSAGQEPSLPNAFDGDLLTYTVIRKWFGLDLGESKPVQSLKLAPRTDDNGIIPGQTYELFYYDRDGWHSAGRQEAQSDELEFTGVPSGALYWLRNLTAGQEERIFTYENGRMRFW